MLRCLMLLTRLSTSAMLPAAWALAFALATVATPASSQVAPDSESSLGVPDSGQTWTPSLPMPRPPTQTPGIVMTGLRFEPRFEQPPVGIEMTGRRFRPQLQRTPRIEMTGRREP